MPSPELGKARSTNSTVRKGPNILGKSDVGGPSQPCRPGVGKKCKGGVAQKKGVTFRKRGKGGEHQGKRAPSRTKETRTFQSLHDRKVPARTVQRGGRIASLQGGKKKRGGAPTRKDPSAGRETAGNDPKQLPGKKNVV